MFFHGWACPPTSNHAIVIFFFDIPIHIVAQTAFFFTNSARKRTQFRQFSQKVKSIARFTLKSWGREQRNIYLSKLDESFHLN